MTEARWLLKYGAKKKKMGSRIGCPFSFVKALKQERNSLLSGVVAAPLQQITSCPAYLRGIGPVVFSSGEYGVSYPRRRGVLIYKGVVVLGVSCPSLSTVAFTAVTTKL